MMTDWLQSTKWIEMQGEKISRQKPSAG